MRAYLEAVSSPNLALQQPGSRIMGTLVEEMKGFGICMPALTAAAYICYLISILHGVGSFNSVLQMRKLRIWS